MAFVLLTTSRAAGFESVSRTGSDDIRRSSSWPSNACDRLEVAISDRNVARLCVRQDPGHRCPSSVTSCVRHLTDVGCSFRKDTVLCSAVVLGVISAVSLLLFRNQCQWSGLLYSGPSVATEYSAPNFHNWVRDKIPAELLDCGYGQSDRAQPQSVVAGKCPPQPIVVVHWLHALI
jgi:hypothetical protein